MAASANMDPLSVRDGEIHRVIVLVDKTTSLVRLPPGEPLAEGRLHARQVGALERRFCRRQALVLEPCQFGRGLVAGERHELLSHFVEVLLSHVNPFTERDLNERRSTQQALAARENHIALTTPQPRTRSECRQSRSGAPPLAPARR